MKQDLARVVLERIRGGQVAAEAGAEILRIMAGHPRDDEPIAIVGMSGVFPDAGDVDALWRNLVDHRDMVREVEPKRWPTDRFYTAGTTEPGTTTCQWQGMVPEIDAFDPLFFAISPREARLMDPQQRLLLQECWRAVEDAGYTPASLSEQRCAVFVGVTHGDYEFRAAETGLQPTAQTMTGSLSSITAARVSHLMNLTGPNLAIDTACSSSLVALDQAVRALRAGSCDAALVGGASIFTTPRMWLMGGNGSMLSPTGRCAAFDASADGFVPSDSVAVLVLRRLSDAERDRDHVYGVIEASGVNHDGRTNGMTAPSPVSQLELLRGVYRDASIDPSTISYVEAHGTGTRLGDPIELGALSQAFRTGSPRTQECLIGSVKSNLGHTLCAAGVVSVIKVLRCMQEEMLVANLHFDAPNPRLPLQDSPFRVCTENTPWPASAGSPRRAAVSAFGLSGTNAHVVLRDHRPTVPADALPDQPEVVCLSARDADSLLDNVVALRSWLAAKPTVAFADVVRTLGDGREHMDRRTCFVVSGLAELVTALDERSTAAGLAARSVEVAAGLSLPGAHEERLARAVTELAATQGPARAGAAAALRDLMDAGADMPSYAQLHPADWPLPHRISLPTYRFRKEPCWIDAYDEVTSQDRSVPVRIPQHASYLDDHKLGPAPVVPGARWLDLADLLFASGTVRTLTDVQWHRLVTPGSDVSVVHRPVDGDRVVTVVDDAGETLVSLRQALDESDTGPHLGGYLDPRSFGDCDGIRVSGSDVYARFAQMGMAYGESFRGISSITIQDDQALVHFDVPSVDDMQDESVLWPHALDAVFQSVLAFHMAEGKPAAGCFLPHRLRRLVYSTQFPRLAVARVTRTAGPADCRVAGFDIDVYDSHGAAVAHLRGYEVRDVAVDGTTGDVCHVVPAFTDAPLAAQDAAPAEPVTLTWPLDVDAAVHAVQASPQGAVLAVTLPVLDPDSTAQTAMTSLVQPVFDLLAELVRETKDIPVRIVLGVPADFDDAHPGHHALEGLTRTVRHEEPRLVVTTVYCSDPARLAGHLAQEAGARDGALTVRYAPRRQVWTLTRVERTQEELPDNLVHGRRFLVVGGMGGLGTILAGDLLQRGASRVVLTGRSEPAVGSLEALRAHARPGALVEFIRADVTRRESCDDMVARAVEICGAIDGVVFVAGVTQDRYLRDKTWDEAAAVLSVKSVGLENVDRAVAGQPLSVFVGFSSIGSLQGNVGQADYAMANAYMDSYLRGRAQRVNRGEALGSCVSVNWPFWADGGMRPDEASLRVMKRQLGLDPLATKDGLHSLYALLLDGRAQCAVLPGRPSDVTEGFVQSATYATLPAPPSSVSARTAGSVVGPDDLLEKTRDLVRGILAEGLELAPERLNARVPLEDYGLDSVMVVTLNSLLGTVFPQLSKTVLYEYRDLESLSAYLATHRAEDCLRAVAVVEPTVAVVEPTVARPAAPVPARAEAPAIASTTVPRMSLPAPEQVAAGDGDPAPIAIVGVSGRFPGARDLDAFWENLREGVDSIVEIPRNRWDPDAGFFAAEPGSGAYHSRWGGFIDGVREFDPLMFHMSNRDAERTDPQERLFLQTCWETLQDAGYSRDSMRGSQTGVFVGSMYSEYQLFGAVESAFGRPTALSANPASIANRVSYTFDFRGPSLTVDTMCSSALSAVHTAVTAIRDGSCDQALVGAVNLSLHENKYQLLGSGNFLSSDGRCRSYGAGGDGYVPGEGCGCVLLKTLPAALRDGDHVYAIIRGTAVNHGGKTSGYSVPNPTAQAELVREAMKRSALTFGELDYIEGHGTGTSLGDPIEITGLTAALDTTRARGRCPLGSVKSNIGHLEAAAGIASLAKVLLMMRHRMLVPSLHSATRNPNIDFEGAPFDVVQQARAWEPGADGRLRALVTSFGAGGSNGAVVLESFDQVPADVSEHVGPAKLLLSARSERLLRDYAGRVADNLRSRSDALETLPLGDRARAEGVLLARLQHTMMVGRDSFRHRVLVEGSNLAEVIGALRAVEQGVTLAMSATRGSTDAPGSGHPVPDAERRDYERQLAQGEADALCLRWLSGQDVEWHRMAAAPVHRLDGMPWPHPDVTEFWFDTYATTRQQSATVSAASVVPALPPATETGADAPSGGSGITTARLRQRVQAQMAAAASRGLRPQVQLTIGTDGVALVTLADAEHNNAFTEEVIEGLMAAFWQIEHDERVRAVVVTGTPRLFCTGGTKDQLLAISRQEISFTDAPFLFSGLQLTSVPVVAAIQGHASGGGFMFGLFADLILISDEGVYSSPFTKYGFTPGMGATYVLQQKLGRGLALEMMMTGRSYTGAEIASRGAGVRCLPQADVLREAMSSARTIASHPRNTSVELKAHMLGSSLDELLATIASEDAMHARTFTQENVARSIATYYRGGEPGPSAEGPPPAEDLSSIDDLLSMIERGEIDPDDAVLLLKHQDD